MLVCVPPSGSVGSEDKHTYTKCSGGLRDARLRLARKVEMREWTARAARLRVDWQRQTMIRAGTFVGLGPTLVPDNLKAGVTHPHRYEPELNPTYTDMATHYGVAVLPTRVGKPRHNRKSTLITSQLPLDKWHDYIGEPTLADAILDRLVHNAHKLNLKGESMRKNNTNLTTDTTNQ